MLKLTITELSSKLRAKEISSTELVSACLEEIRKNDPKINAFLEIFEQDALNQAKEIDNKKNLKPLEGIPIAVKDNILVKGKRNTCGSKILENYIASYDATAIKNLKKAGMIIIGKTNCDEFAMGSSTETSAFKKTANPCDTSRVPGGSSGGSAAAVAANFVPVALGSDTGGSVRQPAAFCGIYGLKPTYGRVSRYGLSALASSFDIIGPMARSAEDCAWIFSAIAGSDDNDATCFTEAVPELINQTFPQIKGLKIGLPKECFGQGVNKEIKEKVNQAIKKLEKLGANIQEISLPYSKYAIAVYYILMPAEASSNLARYDGIRYGFSAHADNLIKNYLETRSQGFGEEVKRRIMLGAYALSAGYYDAYYKKAQQVRTKVIEDYKKVFKKVDLLATPTTPSTAFKFGENNDDPLAMYMNDVLTVSANVVGVPAISIPCGFDSQKLPIGLQLTADHFEEMKLLQAAKAYEVL